MIPVFFSNDRGLNPSGSPPPSLAEDTYKQVKPWFYLEKYSQAN